MIIGWEMVVLVGFSGRGIVVDSIGSSYGVVILLIM